MQKLKLIVELMNYHKQVVIILMTLCLFNSCSEKVDSEYYNGLWIGEGSYIYIVDSGFIYNNSFYSYTTRPEIAINKDKLIPQKESDSILEYLNKENEIILTFNQVNLEKVNSTRYGISYFASTGYGGFPTVLFSLTENNYLKYLVIKENNVRKSYGGYVNENFDAIYNVVNYFINKHNQIGKKRESVVQKLAIVIENVDDISSYVYSVGQCPNEEIQFVTDYFSNLDYLFNLPEKDLCIKDFKYHNVIFNREIDISDKVVDDNIKNIIIEMEE